jgi:hypothetical protein
MASGGLPALAKLRLWLEGGWGRVKKVRNRVEPALEAVAGTLVHLHLARHDYIRWPDDEVKVGHELGKAVGKLRRLKDLALGLILDGRAYHAIGQGLAASGGDSPLPLLWRVGVSCYFNDADVDLVTSLLLPSVRVFSCDFNICEIRKLQLLACALRQAGYEHVLAVKKDTKECEFLMSMCRVVAPCAIGDVTDCQHCRS